jgi:hypothetical protein
MIYYMTLFGICVNEQKEKEILRENLRICQILLGFELFFIIIL